MSNCARPPGLLTFTWALCPPASPEREDPPGLLGRAREAAVVSVAPERGDWARASQPAVALPWRHLVSQGAGAVFCGAGKREGVKEGRRVEATPRGSTQRRVCGVPAPPPPRRELSGACDEGSPFPLAPRRGQSAGAPRARFERARTRQGLRICGPGPPDLGCPRGWASDLPPTPRFQQPSRTSFSIAMKFTTGLVGRSKKLAPSQTFILLNPHRN